MRSRWLWLAAVAYVIALALVGLWSSPVDSRIDVVTFGPAAWIIDQLGLTPGDGYRMIEFGANVVLFVPAGALAMLVIPPLRWWQAAVLGLAASSLIELLQEVLRPARFATLEDVVANTIGATVGAVIVASVRRLRR